jgi:DNA polymerase-3 subunit delta
MGPWLNEFVDRVVASVEFSPPSDAEIPEQVRQLASHHGKSIASQAVDLLVQAVGNDLMALDNELAKLSIFIAQRPEIGPQDVEMVVGELRVRSVFDLCDAILSGNRPGSLSLLGRLLEAGLVVPQLTGALRWRLTLLTQSRRGRRGSGPPQLDAERLEEAFGLLYQTELSVNTGRQSPRMAMTLLTNQLCRLFGTKEK